MTRSALVATMLPLVLLLLGSSQPALMLASAKSAYESSDALAPGVDSTLERELSSAGLTGFSSLLKHAGLLPELELRARFGSALTVFAPTNVALMRSDPALLAFLKLPRNAELLRDVLLYHVVARPVSAFAWEGSYETMQGAPIALHVDALAFQVGETTVKQYRALTLSLNPLSPDERLSAKAADSAAASAQLSAGDAGSSTVVVHTVNALLLPPSVDELLSLTAGDLSIAAGMGEGGRQLAELSGFASASASAPSASPPPPVQPSPPPPTPSSPPPPPPPKSGAHARCLWQLYSSVALAIVVVIALF